MANCSETAIPRTEPKARACRSFLASKTRVLLGLRHHGAKNGFLAGEIEEARLYNRALSPADIKASLKTGPLVFTADKVLASLTATEKAAI